MNEMWFSDSETFAHDNLWVFKRQSDGRTEVFWNDPVGVAAFIEAEQPVLCGFNFRDYDAHILKATLLGWTPEDIKTVNDTIIGNDDRSMVWALFDGQPWMDLPPIIDLFHDIVPRKGLKDIEGNIGLSIEESTVPFDIDRPLTEDERDEVLLYCIHDVTATEALYDLRYGYVKAKSDLCEMRGIDPLTMLKHTNARIVSEVLCATRLGEQPHETYQIPDNVALDTIPEQVIDYVRGITTENCMDNDGSVEFMFHGCPTKVALGGIHGAVPSYVETASDDRVILLQDVGSYYPSLIINNGYMSRAVSDTSVYEDFYQMRMKAKADGDKAKADAAKLVLNTAYGTFKDTYNKMFDPMQGTNVCLSGQLYILDLIEHLFRAVPDGLQLIQINTDGWLISAPRDKQTALLFAVVEWSTRTGFTVDTAEVEKIAQANVNNYVMRDTDGNIKAKGGVVSHHAGGDFRSNSMTIIDAAVTAYLLDGTPIADTVNACDDLSRFQIIAKAGSTFQKVVYVRDGREVPVQRVNRVYASVVDSHGGIFKVKMADGEETGRQRIPLTPEHCVIDNENRGIDTLDKAWYVALAERKASEFLKRDKKERELMAETEEVHNEVEDKPAPRRRATKPKTEPTSEPTVAPFGLRLLELQRKMAEVAKTVVFDRVVEKISHEYADTQQYKVWLSANCSALDLVFGFDVTHSEFIGAINPDASSGRMYAVQIRANVVIRDAHDVENVVVYGVSGLGVNTTAGYAEGGAQTNALRNFILNNYLLDNMGRDGDDVSLADVSNGNTKGYVAPGQKAAIKQTIKAEKAEAAQYAPTLFMSALHDKITQVRAIEGNEEKFSKILDAFFDGDKPKMGENGKALMLKKDAVAALTKAEELIAEVAK